MNTRKIFLLSIPAFVIVFVVVVALLAFMFNVSGPATATQIPADQAAIEAPAAAEVPATNEAASPAAPVVTYENQE